MYEVLSTCFSHFQRAKYIEIINKKVNVILFKFQGFFVCKFENIIWYDLWLFSQKPNLLEKKDTLGPEGCKVAYIHSSLKPWHVSLGTVLSVKLSWPETRLQWSPNLGLTPGIGLMTLPIHATKNFWSVTWEEAVKWRQDILRRHLNCTP